MRELPLQGLFYFYHAAEQGSFKRAAERLFLTPGAMSQQIRQLEERLDVQLFERQHRKVVLTYAGKKLLPHAREAFQVLQAGLNEIGHDPEPSTISISTLASFGQQWLVPRLGDLKAQLPDLTLTLLPSERLINFNTDTVDMCIRFGQGQYAGLESQFLMEDFLYPVCHPLYIERHPLNSLSDLQRCDLLEDTQPDMGWSSWLQQLGKSVNLSKPAIQYEGVHFVVEGALAVQGVALVRHSVAWRYIKQGLLIKPFTQEVPSPYSYFLCAPKAHFRRDKVKAFSQWAQAQAAAFLAESRAD